VRALPRHLGAGVIGGLIAASLLVLVETAIVRLWWHDALLPPHDFARTRMFDFATELYTALRRWAGPASLPAIVPGVYLPGWPDTGRLARDLACVVVPGGLLVGGAIAVARALGGAAPSVAAAALWTLGLGALSDLLLWAASVHVPARPTASVIARNTVLSLIFEGEWVSLLSLLAVATFVVAGRGTLARILLGSSPRRFATAATLGAVALVALLKAPAPSRARASLEDPSRPVPPPGESSAARPNIVLVSIDSLRADHLGCSGYPRPTSPRIDALAASGIRFAAAWSTTSWTLPAHVSLLSGRSLLGHGVSDSSDRIAPSVPLLAELLHGAGYVTAAVVSAPYLSARYGFARGFDHYDDATVSFGSHADSWRGATSPRVHGAVEAWLRAHRREPFFLFVHYWDVHYDYDPPRPFDTMFDPDYRGSITAADYYRNPAIRPGMDERDLAHIRALYDGEIRFTDEHVGRLLDLLSALGLDERTLVVLTADHGDEFFEHGRKGHERTLYEEVLHVPLVIAWPGTIRPGQVVREPVSIMDVTPTLLGVAGLPVPRGIEGERLLSDGLRGVGRRAPLVAELYRSFLTLQLAVRDGPDKFIQSLKFPRVEFYDLAADPGERAPRGLPTDRRRALRAEMARWLAGAWPAYARRGAPSRVTLDAGQVEALRALGYLE
jgi:arylsulfatase A-like enzyme